MMGCEFVPHSKEATPAPDKALMPEAAVGVMERARQEAATQYLEMLPFATEAGANRIRSGLNDELPLVQAFARAFATPLPARQTAMDDDRLCHQFKTKERCFDCLGRGNCPPEEATPTQVEEPEKGATGLLAMLNAVTEEGGCEVFEHSAVEIGLEVIRNYRQVRAALAATNAGQVEASQTVSQDRAVEALEAARQFITNGIEFGYIQMPDADTPDSAHDTLPLIEEALAAFKKIEVGHE
jgi:hypothetical protein